jgi:hypothetical protein
LARYAGNIPRPFEQVWPLIDGVAVSQGWAVSPSSTIGQRFYSKGVSAFSWGASLTVYVHDAGSYTRLTFDTSSTSLIDYGRARGVVEKLIVALGGALD